MFLLQPNPDKSEPKLILQAFDANGTAIKDPFVAFTSPTGNPHDSRVVTNGSNTLLTWIDIVTPGHGFDILGSIVNTSMVVSVQTPATPSADFGLKQNYPNPFNPETTIRYSLAEASNVKLRIFNVRGQLIRTLLDGQQEAGVQAVRWSGRNDSGQSVSSGVYFLRLEAVGKMFTQRLMLQK